MARKQSLLRTVGRAAVLYGAAKAASGSVARQQKLAGHAEPGASVPPKPKRAKLGGRIKSLEQLTDLRVSGALTDEEYEAAKAKLFAH